MRSTPGMIQRMPASFTPAKRPKRNTTPRSYSWSTRTPAKSSAERRCPPDRSVKDSARFPPLIGLRRRAPHGQLEPVDGDHLDALLRGHGLGRLRPPVLAAHEHRALRAERASSRRRPGRAARRRPPSAAGRASARPRTTTSSAERRRGATTAGTSTDQKSTSRSESSGPVEEQRAAEQDAGEPGREEQPVRGDVRLGHQQREPGRQEQEPEPRERQDLHRDQRQHAGRRRRRSPAPRGPAG